MTGTGPLSGLSIVAFDAIGPVPLACSMLSDMGASILTIERPRTESALPGGLTATSRPVKGSTIGIDLKRPAGVQAVLKLLSVADVLIEGFRPGVLERLGLGPDVVREANERIVYARVTGWGQEGPYSSMAGHDINYLGLTGVLDAVGTPKRPLPPLNLVGDYAGGTMFAIVGILAALFERGTTGLGRVVDVAMVDGAAALFGPIRKLADAGVWRDGRQSNLLDGGAPFYRTYRTSDDRFMAVGALEPGFYAAFVSGLGLDQQDLPDRFNPDNWEDLADRFALVFGSRTRDEWQEVFDDTDACVTPVLTMGEVMDHPHNVDRGAIVSVEGESGPAPAPRFSDGHGSPGDNPDETSDGKSILVAWGFSANEVDRLRESGIIADG